MTPAIFYFCVCMVEHVLHCCFFLVVTFKKFNQTPQRTETASVSRKRKKPGQGKSFSTIDLTTLL